MLLIACECRGRFLNCRSNFQVVKIQECAFRFPKVGFWTSVEYYLRQEWIQGVNSSKGVNSSSSGFSTAIWYRVTSSKTLGVRSKTYGVSFDPVDHNFYSLRPICSLFWSIFCVMSIYHAATIQTHVHISIIVRELAPVNLVSSAHACSFVILLLV